MRNALRIGVYQLMFLDRVPPWAAVHETVQLVKEREGEKEAGFVNAILRNLLRGRDSLIPDSQDPIERLSLLWAFPPVAGEEVLFPIRSRRDRSPP